MHATAGSNHQKRISVSSAWLRDGLVSLRAARVLRVRAGILAQRSTGMLSLCGPAKREATVDEATMFRCG
jgi:hypothetical protein